MKAPRSITPAFAALLQSTQLSAALKSMVDKFSKSTKVYVLLAPFLILALWTVSSLLQVTVVVRLQESSHEVYCSRACFK